MAAVVDPTVSIVVPAYNEEQRLGPTVEALISFFGIRREPFEIILVDDGSRDETLQLMLRYAAQYPAIRVVALQCNRGKGRATAVGVGATRGRYVLTTDADLSTPIAEYGKLERALQGDVHIAIASRSTAGSNVAVRQPLYRESMGRIFNLLVQLLLLPGVHDTQCGFKLYRGPEARRLFARSQIDGFAFDVEILYEARRDRMKVAEIPVRWLNSDDSRVSPVRHSLQMLRDIFLLRLGLVRLAPARRPAVFMTEDPA